MFLAISATLLYKDLLTYLMHNYHPLQICFGRPAIVLLGMSLCTNAVSLVRILGLIRSVFSCVGRLRIVLGVCYEKVGRRQGAHSPLCISCICQLFASMAIISEICAFNNIAQRQSGFSSHVKLRLSLSSELLNFVSFVGRSLVGYD